MPANPSAHPCATIITFPATEETRIKRRETLWRESCDGFFQTAKQLGYRKLNAEERGLIDLLRDVRREGQEIVFTTAVAVRKTMAKPGFELSSMRRP